MRKTVKKLIPCAGWYIGELESWFSDMAKEGLILQEFGLIFARFEKAAPSNMKYRIDISKTVEKSQEQIEFYAENGWTFITNRSLYYVYASLADNHATELHTDPAEQAFTLKRLLIEFSLIALLFSSWIMIDCIRLFSKFTFADVLIEANYTIVIIFASAFFLLYVSFRALISVSRLKKSLSNGQPINHSAPWKKNRILCKILLIVFFAVSLPLVIFNIVSVGDKTMPQVSNSLPIVRLEEIEQNPDLIRDHFCYEKNVDLFNYYSYYSSFFAPAQYRTFEHGLVLNEKWKQGSPKEGMTYSPELETKMYELRYASMNEWVLTLSVKKFASVECEQFTEISNQNFDKLLVHQELNTIELFAVKGEFVVWLLYNGNADLDTVIASVANKIDLIAD